MKGPDSPLRRQLQAARHANSGKPLYLPEGCPVTALGGDGQRFHYLNAIQQLVQLDAQQHSKNNITALFSPFVRDWCWQHYPKSFDKETGEPRDYKVDALVVDLMAEAQARGESWDPNDAIFGRGVWPGEDGDLRVHLGKTLIIGRRPREPGVIGSQVYPRAPEWKGPAPDAQAEGEAGPAAELLALLDCWNWAEPRLAPRLLLGWIVVAWLCGALDWRPHVWLIAPRGSGKTTLLDLIGHVLQKGRYLLASEDASGAAVRGKLGCDARPVCLDETEPSEDNRRLNEMVKLLRLAASGGTAMRSSVDQQVTEQTLRFAAICASVVKPSLTSQDASRIAVLTLRKPRAGTAPPTLRPQLLELLGQRLFRRALDGWARWHDGLDLWKRALVARGLDGRNADQFGTLLNAAWLAENDALPDSDSLDEWAQITAEHTAPDRAEERPEWFRLIETLAATTLRDEAGRSEASVAELLEVASQARRRPDLENGGWLYTTPSEAERAQSTLARHGLRFEPMLDAASGRPLRRDWDDAEAPLSPQGNGPQEGYVAVANSHPVLARLFERSQWAARAGAPGAWKGVLEQARGAVPGTSVRFGARTSRAVKVPIELFFDGVADVE